MKTTDARSKKSLMSFGVAALLAVGAATAQIAIAGSTGIDATGSYQSEVQACMSGATQQSRDDCMKEARNAQAEKQRGRLETYGNNDSHAMARCDVHQVAEDRAACQARVMGMGEQAGSVASGGVIRRVETVVLPEGQHSVTIQPQTSDPVVLVPSTSVMGNSK
jgi:preprotein translocase subunit SecF